ncbi:fimbrial protein [Methylovorus sp. MM2]|uniref:PilN domain-containing protein n=1 Tax=Methylovorus sp. MM2 TaxID=1848038 RepID=UPI0007DF1B36|nr:PilN domain-containing protein [Methylovorus sp. MM2]OAM52180.1 fimbrial protein [Methylovorus sp. MM2]
MIRINLLPHRQIKRAERQREFNLMLVGTLLVGAVLVFSGQGIISSRIDAQQSRNARLDQAIANLDKEISVIKDLKSQISTVLERKQAVEGLQTNRSQAVILLDEVARQLPEGLYIKSIKQKDKLVVLEGIADTNARVATLVRNLSSSNWLESPSLVEIKSVVTNGIKQNAFTLNVNVKTQQTSDDNSKPKKSKGRAS